MVGALYSFSKVVPLLQAGPRQHDEIIKDARKIVHLMRPDVTIKDGEHDAWFDGYYLNNAEYRIALAFHCLLKTCYPCNRKHGYKHKAYVMSLIEEILNREKCPTCSSLPIVPNKRCEKILRDFYSGRNHPTGRPTTGRYLFEVHSRINSLKHTPDPDEDLIPTTRRMKEACKGLLGIYALFGCIGKERGALRLS